jgi:Predicted ATPase
MINNLKRIYDDYVSNNFINSDKKQLKILEHFEQIWNQNQKLNFLSKSKKIKGIYLHGPSGSGKTFLINLFINNILKSKKYHFNHFMINLHAFIDNPH